MAWKILVERGNLGFAAAHFITLAGTVEPLHGHNYGVRVEVEGALTPDSVVLNFLELKEVARALCKALDHRFLLPLHNPHLHLTEHETAWEIAFGQGERYLMPKSAVVPLAIDNATTERLAELLARQLAEHLHARGVADALTRITVGVEETEMQTAFFTLALPAMVPTGP